MVETQNLASSQHPNQRLQKDKIVYGICRCKFRVQIGAYLKGKSGEVGGDFLGVFFGG